MTEFGTFPYHRWLIVVVVIGLCEINKRLSSRRRPCDTSNIGLSLLRFPGLKGRAVYGQYLKNIFILCNTYPIEEGRDVDSVVESVVDTMLEKLTNEIYKPIADPRFSASVICLVNILHIR